MSKKLPSAKKMAQPPAPTPRPKSFDEVKPKAAPETKVVKPKRFKSKDRITYKARSHEGAGAFVKYESSLKGEWVVIDSQTHGILRLRPSQVTHA